MLGFHEALYREHAETLSPVVQIGGCVALPYPRADDVEALPIHQDDEGRQIAAAIPQAPARLPWSSRRRNRSWLRVASGIPRRNSRAPLVDAYG